MNPFIQQLVDDLKAFSSELLLPGLHTTQQVSTGMGTVASTTALLKSIDFLTGLIPQLVEELQTTDATHKVMVHYTTSPKQATFSRRASDYQQDAAKRLLPAHWFSILPVVETDVRPLRWLIHLLDLQQTALDKVYKRTMKYIDDSLFTQQGQSSYAQNDRATLLGMRTRLDDAHNKLEHARATLLRTVRIKLVSSPNLPYPYPRSSAWQRLRRFAQQLIKPKEYLPSFLHNLLHGTVEIADTPYLYQRWCGVKLLEAFESFGWLSPNDPTGALFLGGEVRLYKAKIELSIWIEPRLSRHKGHPSGFICKEVTETHPDYLIVTPGPSGIDAFILDPTTTADMEVRQGKSKYLNTIEATSMASVAGIPLVRNPLRAWSAAPLHTPHCELEDSEGCTGTIPMHPLDWTPQPLKEWVRDIHNYALAWGTGKMLTVD
ncbi:hypothetical protein [Candidatus Parabeggiatoa sp. HSG14]|uniref:hypothetical protein n=1 Tax=Candidatus Parabeggiatoa sp. HSG14 TaxID=3055593 RepID=UPI0025A92834|nr:hypothetical protein [Thiotrichales bacterium HSG14]